MYCLHVLPVLPACTACLQVLEFTTRKEQMTNEMWEQR